nr:PepSY-associated TM helix domain-containing protein [Altericroceibacterium endophyticum]
MRGHAAIGLIAGALIFLLSLSGVLAVSAERWQRWEEPAAPEMTDISPAAAQAALEAAIAADGKPTTHAYLHMPTDKLPRVIVTTDYSAHYVTEDGELAAPEDHVWTEFILALHYYLNLPMTPGLILVGIVGVALSAAAVTGVLAHPRIFRDAFRLRPRGQKQLAQADWHNRIGSWTLPFTLAVALTGAAIGLGVAVFQGIAAERFGGDMEAVYGPLFGDHPHEDPAPAPLARADIALTWMADNHPQRRITYVTLEHPQTAGQQISILADHDQRLIYGESYVFDGDGFPDGKIGLSDGALGQQAIASAYKLHFGNFAGIPVELAYILFGLGLCAVTATGMSLWLMKRRARGLAEPRLEAFWSITVWGSPLLLIMAYWLRMIGGPAMPLTAFFWVALPVAMLAGMTRPSVWIAPILRYSLAAGLVITALAHGLIFGFAPLSSLAINAALIAMAAAIITFSPRAGAPWKGRIQPDAGTGTGPRDGELSNTAPAAE